jgi:hypothetical protein
MRYTVASPPRHGGATPTAMGTGGAIALQPATPMMEPMDVLLLLGCIVTSAEAPESLPESLLIPPPVLSVVGAGASASAPPAFGASVELSTRQQQGGSSSSPWVRLDRPDGVAQTGTGPDGDGSGRGWMTVADESVSFEGAVVFPVWIRPEWGVFNLFFGGAANMKVKSKLKKLKTDDSLVGAPIFAPWSGPGKHQLPCWRVPAAVHMHGEGVPDTLMVFAEGRWIYGDGCNAGTGGNLPPTGPVNAACQKALDAVCNAPANAECTAPTVKFYGQAALPMVGLYDGSISGGKQWRCYARNGLDATHI